STPSIHSFPTRRSSDLGPAERHQLQEPARDHRLRASGRQRGLVMPRGYVPDAGDIVWMNFTPQAGHEQAGHRPALVLSPAAYNRSEEHTSELQSPYDLV